MARPLSIEKRQAILDAAARVLAAEGTRAPTAKIAKAAGVADGTLFLYFKTKDELLNSLYLAIKAEIAAVLLDDFPSSASVEARLKHVWRRHIAWSLEYPSKKQALALLTVSPLITRETSASSRDLIGAFDTMIRDTDGRTSVSPAFAAAIMTALADVTITFISTAPEERESYMNSGFASLTSALFLRQR